MFVKDPNATLDYTVDWTDYLNGAAILTSQWIAPSGITVDSDVNDGQKATAYISGGVIGQTYTLVNRITFSSGGVTVTDERSIHINVRDK